LHRIGLLPRHLRHPLVPILPESLTYVLTQTLTFVLKLSITDVLKLDTNPCGICLIHWKQQ
ncbi:MAG: hypothetical protein IKE17_15895, partial [Clostridia bacterium]|nr:hypothetical protein [Clostridia bacterium]